MWGCMELGIWSIGDHVTCDSGLGHTCIQRSRLYCTALLLIHFAGASSGGPSDPDAARDADLLRVFQCWVTALRSPSVSLKEHGFRRLSDVLECVCQLWQVRSP
jgi:hypothetical protein